MSLKGLARQVLDRNAVRTQACNEAENRATTPATTSAVVLTNDDLAERSAIIEEGAGVPREWAEAFAGLQAGPPPANVSPQDWLGMLNGVGRFLDGWANHAHALGWSPRELFGLGDGLRRDRRGAAWLIGAAKVVLVTAEAITLEANTGSSSRIYRATRTNAGPAWGAPAERRHER